MDKKWIFIIVLLFILGITSIILASIVSLFIPVDLPVTGNVAVMSITGTIFRGQGDGFFEETASSKEIVNFIEMADKNANIKAILLDINSGGGAVVATKEIVDAVKKTDKLTVAVIHDIGASGAYWIASSADRVFADELSIVGSLGVIASYLEFTNFLERYGVNYRRLVAGEYKDIGVPFRNLTIEEQLILQEQLDLIHKYMLDGIAENRQLTTAQKNEVASANIYIGLQAKELNLIDEFGGINEAVSYIEKELGITADLAEYKKKRTIFDVLARVFGQQSFFVGQGIGKAMFDKRFSNGIEIRT